MVSKGFPNVTTSGRQYNIGEKPCCIHRTMYSTKVSICTAEFDIQLHFEWLQVQRSTCHTLLSLYLQFFLKYKYIVVSGSSTTCTAKLLFHKLNKAS